MRYGARAQLRASNEQHWKYIGKYILWKMITYNVISKLEDRQSQDYNAMRVLVIMKSHDYSMTFFTTLKFSWISALGTSCNEICHVMLSPQWSSLIVCDLRFAWQSTARYRSGRRPWPSVTSGDDPLEWASLGARRHSGRCRFLSWESVWPAASRSTLSLWINN